jgi:hypothetical protein
MHSPQILEIYGPFNVIVPLLSVFVAYAHVAVYTFPRNKKVFGFLTAFYIFSFVLSFFPAAASSTEWGVSTDFLNFAVFGSIPFVGIFSMYYLYQQDPEVKELMHTWPTHYLCAHQLYRLGGSAFLYLYLAQDMKSYMNLQTGVLDTFMGLSAIPMALYVKNKPLKDVKMMLFAWHAIGLYDMLACFSFAIVDFFGIYHIVPSPAYIAFFPVTLVCYFQVAWAIGMHFMYLTSFETISEAQQKNEPSTASATSYGALS